MTRGSAVLAAAIAALAWSAGPAAAAPPERADRSGPSFHGVVSQAPLSERDFERMAAGGVDSLRVVWAWNDIEPAPGVSRFAATDRVVLLAANHGIDLLPSVAGNAGWAGGDPTLPPIHGASERAAWAAFLARLVNRYGPGGEIWQGIPNRRQRRPLRIWQIWNEPNFPRFWQPRPDAREYARLVELSGIAIHGADPRAKVMLAGIAPVISGVPTDRYLRELYATRGIKRHFEIAALHPYARGVRRLGKQVERLRAVMRAAGDRRTPLAITEMGWASRPSEGSPDGAATRGRRGQARMVERAYRLVERHRRDWRLRGAYWYGWQDVAEPELRCTFCQYAGLFDVEGRAKPSWRAYRRAASTP